MDNLFWAFGVFVILMVLFKIIVSWMHVVRADEVIVISGGQYPDPSGNGTVGYKVIDRGVAVKYPVIEEMHSLSLEAMLIPLKVERVTSSGGIPINVEATANVAINADEKAILGNAINRLLTKSPRDIMEIARQTLEGNLRETIASNSPEELIREKKKFRSDLVKASKVDLESLGLELISLVVQNVADDAGYLDNLTKKTFVGKERDVLKIEAKYKSDALMAKSESERRQAVASAQANDSILAQERLLNQEKEGYRGDVESEIQQAQATIQERQARAAVEVQGVNVKLREMDNEVTVLVEARAKRQAAEILANADAERIRIVQGARNQVLQRKLEILKQGGDTGALVLFINQLPEMVKIYEAGARHTKVDKLLVMNDANSYGLAVNRGPEAFHRFLGALESMTGLSVTKLAERAVTEAQS